MSDSLDERLTEVFRAVFELSPDADLDGVRQGVHEAWDSLGHVSLVTALESEFEIAISAADSLEVTSFEDALLLVEDLMRDLSADPGT